MLYRAMQENEKTNNLLKFGTETEAIVIENIIESTAEGHSYRPKFEYRDGFGSTRVAKGDVASNPPAYSVGQKVKLIYDPDDFNQVKVKSSWGLHGSFIITLIMG
jgi:hypothetical protein